MWGVLHVSVNTRRGAASVSTVLSTPGIGWYTGVPRNVITSRIRSGETFSTYGWEREHRLQVGKNFGHPDVTHKVVPVPTNPTSDRNWPGTAES